MTSETSKRILTALIAALLLMLGLFMGFRAGRRLTAAQVQVLMGELSSDNKLSTTLSLIQNQYVDSVQMDSLAEHVLPTLMEQLDPHSVYIPAKELQEVDESLEGEFDGIGVVFNMSTDTVIVLNVIPAGPSAKAGVLAGDRIMRVNDTLIAGRKMDTREVMKHLRGPRGSKVKLSLQRRGLHGLTDVEVTRGAIPIKSVEASVMLTPTVGFIKLSQFSKTSYEEVRRAMGQLKAQGMKGLVLDLRGNPGGFLDQAILIANEFLPKNRLIVYTENRRHEQVKEYSTGNGSTTQMPLAVLIDEASASSSEILAGALQDNDRGTIIGRRSFGKGLVQQQFPFDDGSALRLTVARYYTPTGRSIQKPYIAGRGEDYELDMLKRYEHNEFFSADSIRFNDSLRYTTPRGKVVYGGGGIMPDIFMPLDTTQVTKYYIEAVGRNTLYRYTLDFTDRYRQQLQQVRSVQDMETFFGAHKSLVQDFTTYAARHGHALSPRQIRISYPLLEAQLKANIARNTAIEDGGFYYYVAPIDNTLQRAVQQLLHPAPLTTSAPAAAAKVHRQGVQPAATPNSKK